MVYCIQSRGEANEVEGWVPSRGVQIPWKTFQKDLEKPLDKLHKVWYTNNVKREVPTRDTMMGDEVHRVKKVRKKKNSLLTNPTKHGIINTSKGVLKDTSTKVLFHGAVATPPSTSRKAQDPTCKGVGESREKKKWQKSLTNPLKCDTIRVQKERDGNPETRAAHESEVRPVPDDPTARCSYLRNINVNQCPRG